MKKIFIGIVAGLVLFPLGTAIYGWFTDRNHEEVWLWPNADGKGTEVIQDGRSKYTISCDGTTNIETNY